MKKLTKSTTQYHTQQSIESINRTEACVFYVLGQLSHGDKPSHHILNNFDSILICLLNYLKNAKVRNPRALRILNRLTKNQFCFYNFVLTQFPYKIKKIFYDDINLIKRDEITQADPQSKTSKSKKIQNSSSSNVASLKRCYSTSFNIPNANAQEKDIEKEMSVYLNSNKAFFDAHTYFPSFESIEFTLCNNLKSLCMSSGDHGFSCLTSMMKNSQRKAERIACALVAPFILRNCRALNYIMVELNGIDLILDALFDASVSPPGEDQMQNGSLKFKAIVCVQRILNFVGYKRDMKQISENFELAREKIYESQSHFEQPKTEDFVCFEFNVDSELKNLKIRKGLLTKASEYFNALLNGHFVESLQKDFQTTQKLSINDVSYEAFKTILELIQFEEASSAKSEQSEFLNSKLSFDLCVELILTCDKFCLIHLKDMFVSILVCNYFNLSTWPLCFHLAYSLDNSYLANASVEFLLCNFRLFPIKKSKLQKLNKAANFEDIVDSFSDESTNKNEDVECGTSMSGNDLIHFEDVFDWLLTNLSELSPSTSSSNDQVDEGSSCSNNILKDQFRKILKNALSEIIKNNYWKL